MLMSALTNTQKLDTENAPISLLKFLKIQRKRLLGVSKDWETQSWEQGAT